MFGKRKLGTNFARYWPSVRVGGEGVAVCACMYNFFGLWTPNYMLLVASIHNNNNNHEIHEWVNFILYLFQLPLTPYGVDAATDMETKYAWAPLPTREQQLQSLEKDEFDILVVGGGATGCGVALDSVSRGRCLNPKWKFGKVSISWRHCKLYSPLNCMPFWTVQPHPNHIAL